MEHDGITRLKQHADLVQRLVKQIPAALHRPGLTVRQAARLHEVVEKGVKDFNNVLRIVNESEADASYLRAANSLAKIWLHLADAAEHKLRELEKEERR